jgi:Zn-finger nucleic acid-binding protein
MIKKEHGPAFKKELIPLALCPACKGCAVISGVFHEIECAQCYASGGVRFDSGQALELQELVTQLGLNLRIACKQIEKVLARPALGVSDYYVQNNRRGPGATNFTGD